MHGCMPVPRASAGMPAAEPAFFSLPSEGAVKSHSLSLSLASPRLPPLPPVQGRPPSSAQRVPLPRLLSLRRRGSLQQQASASRRAGEPGEARGRARRSRAVGAVAPPRLGGIPPQVLAAQDFFNSEKNRASAAVARDLRARRPRSRRGTHQQVCVVRQGRGGPPLDQREPCGSRLSA